MKDFLINTIIPITLYSNTLISRDTNKSFKLDGDLLETITNYTFNVDHSNPQHRKLTYESGKEMKFSIKQKGQKSPRNDSFIRLLESPSIFLSASGVSMSHKKKSSSEKNIFTI